MVAPRVKQELYAACRGIDATQIRALMKVTAMACQRKVVDIVRTTVLPGDHVLDMV